ncbi:hypothetical protein TVAG_419840 [Trichomonas vaginalis G3]|uniref:Uncharacterized protein n=1 Tax=Trichomonas vaginalis (strain ATCC PRA-98 / G3) TaxID=412133 RepID=A2EIV8_TRIV3|nr:endonuclease protein [Trichomonas vaginalis G3]EAY07442.1 hypothetical protein TVAG_419840 [Trichomonas vaginalis G3]KAI5484652.1 endonuclease protein [Trichomonas vaginalis G3]|eukprot:XP_001319665.1 hypothetical protein [Trichomonas vaginalis G3]
MSIIDRIIEFIRLPPKIVFEYQQLKQHSRKSQLIDFIIKQFQDRIDTLNKQKGHLKVDLDINQIFVQRNTLQKSIGKIEFSPDLSMIDFECKRIIRDQILLMKNRWQNVLFKQLVEEFHIEERNPLQDLTDKIKKVCDIVPVSSLIRCYFDMTRDQKTSFMEISDDQISLITEIPQSNNNLKIINKSEFDARERKEKLKLSQISSGKSIKEYIKYYDIYLKFCNNFPNTLRRIKERMKRRDIVKANEDYTKLYLLDDWAQKIINDKNNPLVLIAQNYHDYFSIIDNIISNNGGANVCFIVPKSVPPKVATEWKENKPDNNNKKEETEAEMKIERPTTEKARITKSQVKTGTIGQGKGISRISVDSSPDVVQRAILESMKMASNDVILRFSNTKLYEDSTKEILDQNKDVSNIDCIIKS